MMKVLIAALLFAGVCSKSLADEIKMPECDMSRSVETPVTFFISNAARKTYDPYVIEGHIQRWIRYSNRVLNNSCIPMVRSLDKIVYADELLSEETEELSVVHNLLEYYYPDEIARLNESKTALYGFVFKKDVSQFTTDWCGETKPAVYPQFFVIGLTCADHVFEHELGHLAWANHDIETLSAQTGGMPFDLPHSLPLSLVDKVKKYAYGYVCGGKGTIMSYAEDRHPFYSSPDISYGKVECGHARYADNARVLREYAAEIAID